MGVEILYSLKANPSLGVCQLIAGRGLGADVVSAGELVTALEAGFPSDRIQVGGPYKSPETLAQLETLPQAMLSIDSLCELHSIARRATQHRTLLRLRPDFRSSAAMVTGPDSRFGIPAEELHQCREIVRSAQVVLTGFHVFAGSQVLDPAAVVRHLRGAAEQCLRAAELLGITPLVLNLGGGFGVPYGTQERDLDLGPIADELAAIQSRISPARIRLELGRYVVAQTGWYMTTVVAKQIRQSRPAVVVDGGIHQRTDLCGIGLRTTACPPLVLGRKPSILTPTDVLGCLCLPDDVLSELCPLPVLSPGDLLAFPNAGAYGLTSSPILFLGHPAPAEVAFGGTGMTVLRPRPTASETLRPQRLIYEERLSGS
jgi:diaminopimelate decarboxylase